MGGYHNCRGENGNIGTDATGDCLFDYVMLICMGSVMPKLGVSKIQITSTLLFTGTFLMIVLFLDPFDSIWMLQNGWLVVFWGLFISHNIFKSQIHQGLFPGHKGFIIRKISGWLMLLLLLWDIWRAGGISGGDSRSSFMVPTPVHDVLQKKWRNGKIGCVRFTLLGCLAVWPGELSVEKFRHEWVVRIVLFGARKL